MVKPRRENALVQQETRREETRRPAHHTYSRAGEFCQRGKGLEGGLGSVAMSQQTDKNDVWTEEFAVVLQKNPPGGGPARALLVTFNY